MSNDYDSLVWEDYCNTDTVDISNNSEEEIARAENQIGYVFPDDFKDCLKVNAGKAPSLECVKVVGPLGSSIIPLRCLFYLKHLNERSDRFGNLVEVWRNNKVKLGSHFVPFAMDGGDNGYFALDYSDGSQPKIVYLMLDSLDAGPMFVANSFTEFLEKLHY